VIVTLTAHPSIDQTVALAGPLERGAVLRADSATSQPGGKGVNISRAAVAARVATLAVVPARLDDPFVVELAGAGVPVHAVRPAADIRVNVTVTEPDGTTTKINSSASPVGAELRTALEEALHVAAEEAAWVVLAGSLPPGLPARWYADLAAALRDSGARVAVDTSDEPLRAIGEHLELAAPALLKPNAEELASLAGTDPVALEADPTAAAEAARALVRRGAGAVLATLGARGAVLVDGDSAWLATPPPTTVVSTVGAGDSSLFGYLLGDLEQLPPDRRLALAVAYGSAAAALPGTTIPHPRQVRPELVSVRALHAAEGTLR
jgi:1-phosphofructokinase